MEAKTEANKVTKTGSTTHLHPPIVSIPSTLSSRLPCCEHHFLFPYFLVLVNEVRIAMMGWEGWEDHLGFGGRHGASRFCLLLLSCEPLYCTDYGGRMMTQLFGTFPFFSCVPGQKTNCIPEYQGLENFFLHLS